MNNTLSEIQRRRTRRTLSEVTQKLEEALRLSRRRDAVVAAFGKKRPE